MNVRRSFSTAEGWRRRAVASAAHRLDTVSAWLTRHKWRFMLALAALTWAGLMLWFLIDLGNGRVQGSGAQVGAGGAVGAAVVGTVLSPLVALAVWLALLLIDEIVKLVAPIVLFFPLILWTPLYASWQALVVAVKALLLIPLFFLFLGSRLVQLWRGIFFTCPSRVCSYRGLPGYVCPACGSENAKLWPNLIGLLWHPCTGCGTPLPTLDVLGRKHLGRVCGGDGMPLLGRHAGRAPERLIAVVGGPGSGKTSYLLMLARRLTRGGQPIQAEIDDPAQEFEFRREWARLESGIAPSKTAATVNAFLMYARVGGSTCQLYLYDAPGEEFLSIRSMTKQRYFPLLEGFIMLVDPLDIDGFAKVVVSTLAIANSAAAPGRGGKLPFRVAVVISKADERVVKDAIGDVAAGVIASEKCRAALISWGARNALVSLESHFEFVDYFACSPLGRAVDSRSGTPFSGFGVLQPLTAVLAHHPVPPSA
jgi:hypothetical protein